MTNNLGQRAKFLRIQKGLNLRQLAQETGVSASTLSRFENGNLNVAYSTVLAVFEALGQLQQSDGFIVELTEAEKDYIWLLTALDAMRIHVVEDEQEQDRHHEIRHSLRQKLFELGKQERVNS